MCFEVISETSHMKENSTFKGKRFRNKTLLNSDFYLVFSGPNSLLSNEFQTGKMIWFYDHIRMSKTLLNLLSVSYDFPTVPAFSQK